MNTTQSILRLASIRAFTDRNMPEGMYFDVFDIRLPSEESDYSEYDAIVSVSSINEKINLERLYRENNLNVAVILL